MNSNNLIQNVQMTKATAITAPFWARVITTFFGIGYLQPGPGTWASALTLLAWWLLSSWIAPAWQPWVALLLALAVTLLGVPAATRVASATGIKDPQFVVIDEVAGQLLTMIAVPVSEISAAGLYTFSWVRHFKTPADPSPGTLSWGNRDCGR